MARYPSLLLAQAHAFTQVHGTGKPEWAVLKAVGKVEQTFGLSDTLNGMLSAYVSASTTLAANGAMPLDAAINALNGCVKRLTETRDALAAGSPIVSFRMVDMPINQETQAAWSGKPGGSA